MSFLSENEELQQEKAKFKQLKGSKKLEYFWDYYKFPFLIIVCLILFVSSYINTMVSAKEALLNVTFVNLNGTAEMPDYLNRAFIQDALAGNPKKQEIGLEFTQFIPEDEVVDYQYAMAIQTKTVAAIASQGMDLVFMDEKAFRGYASENYLMPLDTFLQEKDPALFEAVKDRLIESTVILSDNRDQTFLDSSVEYHAETAEMPVGMDLSGLSLFSPEVYQEPVYLGIITNTPHTELVLKYLHYLLDK